VTLRGKVAIVTGGNTGIGKAVVLALAAEGASIVIDYVTNPDATEALEQQVRDLGDKVTAVQADVSKVADLERLIALRSARSGASTSWSTTPVSRPGPPCSTRRGPVRPVLDINLKSAFFGTQLAAKQMIAQGDGGRIINMTSVHEDWPMPGNTAYCLSKGGMRMLTRTQVWNWLPQRPGGRGRSGSSRHAHQQGTVADPKALATLDNAIPWSAGAARGDSQRRRLPGGPGASYLTATTIFADAASCRAAPDCEIHGRGRGRGRLRWRYGAVAVCGPVGSGAGAAAGGAARCALAT